MIGNSDTRANQPVRVGSKLQPRSLFDAGRSYASVAQVEIPWILSPGTLLISQQHAIRILGLPSISQTIRIPFGPRVQVNLAKFLPRRKCLLQALSEGLDEAPSLVLPQVSSGIAPPRDVNAPG